MQVSPGKALALGTIELERGASLAGWVAVEDGVIQQGLCTARLTAVVAGGASLKSISDLERTAFERQVGRDGFFQLSGLAPGSFSLEVQQPGYPPVRLSPVRIDAGAETLLPEPLLLRHSLDLQFEIRPPLDWLDRPWHAQIFQLGERQPNPLVFEAPADEEGRLKIPSQSAGRFRVDLKDSLGNRLYSGEHVATGSFSAPQSIEVRFVTVEGKIRLGENPLVATLWFGGSRGATSAKMEAASDGRFQGVLPKEGLWRIEIEAARPGFPTWIRAEVHAARSGKASLDIVLPDTRVFGRVVDEQGKPVSNADVSIQSENLELSATADADGHFEVRALPEGQAWLAAESLSRVSDRIFVTLMEGREIGPIELRLHPNKQLSGTVVSSRGPVAGSRVMVLARAPGGGEAIGMTDTDGAFRVDLPQAVSRVEAVVSAPGFALRAFDALTEGEPLSFQVTEEGGNLEITLPLSDEDFMRENVTLAVFQNHLYVPTPALVQWAFDQGQPRERIKQTLHVPMLAPGEYRVCLMPRRLESSLASVLVPEGAACDSGLLAPGATLTLRPSRPR